MIAISTTGRGSVVSQYMPDVKAFLSVVTSILPIDKRHENVYK
jgi:hypothetical protein